MNLGKVNRFLLEWSAAERGLDQDKVGQYIDTCGTNERNLRHPILPLALVQQSLRYRETQAMRDLEIDANGPGQEPQRTRNSNWKLGTKLRGRSDFHDFVATVLSVAAGTPSSEPSTCADEIERLGNIISVMGGGQRAASSLLPHLLASADAVIDQHCLNELDVMKLGGHDANPILRDLSSRDELPAFISAKARSLAVLGVTGNPGDAFSIPVVRYMSNRSVAPRGVWADLDEPLFFSVGSVLQHVRDRGVTWGTGAIVPPARLPKPRVTQSIYLAVRGPRTRDIVILAAGQNPAVAGDPALLLPQVFEIPNSEPDIETGFLPHGVDREDIATMFPHEFLIRNYNGFVPLIEGILRCRQIVASSLHGMIFAHALGRPVSLVNVGDRLTGGDFKFIDYLASVGTYVRQPRQSIHRLDTSQTLTLNPSVLEQQQRRLVNNFPSSLRADPHLT